MSNHGLFLLIFLAIGLAVAGLWLSVRLLFSHLDILGDGWFDAETDAHPAPLDEPWWE